MRPFNGTTALYLLLRLCILRNVIIVQSLSISDSSRAEISRSRLSEAFRSPSKKLTFHPEILLPEPSDPTALLLRATEVKKLSQALRTKAKANAVFVEGTVDALSPMGKDQEDARGNFPGPVPIIYILGEGNNLSTCLERLENVDGVEGMLVPLFGGKTIESVDSYVEESKNHPTLSADFGAIWNAGLQPIPEIVLSPDSEWPEEDVVRLVDAVQNTCGGMDPVSIVLTSAAGDKAANKEDVGDDEPLTPKITIPASVSKRTTFIGSVRTTAGEGRMNAAISELASCNFNGAFLRADCVPGYRFNPDLSVVGGFWSAAIGDLKSLKSKSFSFRSKVKLEKDVPSKFMHYSFSNHKLIHIFVLIMNFYLNHKCFSGMVQLSKGRDG
jgi:hypothetical protein